MRAFMMRLQNAVLVGPERPRDDQRQASWRDQEAAHRKSTVHIACAFDRAMAVPAIVLASSLKKLARPGRKMIFHALECDESGLPGYAKYLLESEDFEIRSHKISIEKFKKYNLSIATVRSNATFGRLAIPQLIEEADRVVYLDCDILVSHAIEDLFDTDMQGFPWPHVET